MSRRMGALLLASIVFMIADPIRANLQDEPISDIYLTVVGILMLILIITISTFFIKYHLRKKELERIKKDDSQEELNIESLNQGEYVYQEPYWMIHHFPVQIFNAEKEAIASLQITFKNSYEKWVTLLGIMNYRNIEVKDLRNGDIIYFEHLPIRQSFWRDRWKVIKNGERYADFSVAPVSKRQVQNQILFFYQSNNGEHYEIVNPRLSLETEIKPENGEMIFQAKRSFLEIKTKGKQGNRGRKHRIDVSEDSPLTLIEQIGMYQQSIVKVNH
ncbi:putative hydrolase [Bacillus sp. TS-2]|nr:putative hydrolase [Bacillus sp. TS-2]